ncbi:MAG: iron-sulfur cluster assembly scaffold protein [Candidatus Berkelbacteria bacterium]|nr:iron-sulfur cluster assembly scaffold protein [Candidatus Berkelbacteria bacterium]
MKSDFDVKEQSGTKWIYSQKVEDHFFSPRNVMTRNIKKTGYNGYGAVGSPACGDVMRVWLKIKNNKIIDFKWKTFGCASAIAATSILSEMATGKSIDLAYKITAQDIVKKLGGLPKRKIHCSILGDQALRLAIENYRNQKPKKVL